MRGLAIPGIVGWDLVGHEVRSLRSRGRDEAVARTLQPQGKWNGIEDPLLRGRIGCWHALRAPAVFCQFS